MKKFWILLIAASLATAASAAEKKAAKAAEKPTAKPAFATTLNAGLTMTDGNSETLAANASLVTEGEKEGLGSVRAGVEGNYGESTVNDEKETTVENAKVFANVKKTLTPRTFAVLDGSVLYDDVALVDYRVTLGPGLGVYLVKSDKHELSLEIGPSYVWEKVDGVTDDFLALRIAERGSCQITDNTKFVQSVECVPNTEDFNDYLITAEAGVETAMSERWSLRVVLQDKYDSTPAADAEHNDISLIAGVAFTL
ncbi:MAG TPA: DUF481 domain-containing protein [Kiritimatiellia bacterium]|nr:DUF481 domain-containing protein [Kiritimatiellia bacterium]